MRLQGKKALITGAGSGIGAATASLFAEHGASVFAVDIADGRLAKCHADNPAISCLEIDITTEGAAENDYRTSCHRFGWFGYCDE